MPPKKNATAPGGIPRAQLEKFFKDIFVTADLRRALKRAAVTRRLRTKDEQVYALIDKLVHSYPPQQPGQPPVEEEEEEDDFDRQGPLLPLSSWTSNNSKPNDYHLCLALPVLQVKSPVGPEEIREAATQHLEHLVASDFQGSRLLANEQGKLLLEALKLKDDELAHVDEQARKRASELERVLAVQAKELEARSAQLDVHADSLVAREAVSKSKRWGHEIGVAVRNRWIEQMVKEYSWADFDAPAKERGDLACHSGHCETDVHLYRTGVRTDVDVFHRIYGIFPHEVPEFLDTPRVLEMLNWRGYLQSAHMLPNHLQTWWDGVFVRLRAQPEHTERDAMLAPGGVLQEDYNWFKEYYTRRFQDAHQRRVVRLTHPGGYKRAAAWDKDDDDNEDDKGAGDNFPRLPPSTASAEKNDEHRHKRLR
ncbi:MAG: hypothetical protein M1826_005058 [Phylliscum demangeonii]|nr:MAG: hypothetical protein M1826_005058 [Phylliscum demangeonii]